MSSIQTRPRRRLGQRLPAVLVGLIGVVLGLFALEFLLTHPDPLVWWRVEILGTIAVSAVVVVSGYWLSRSRYESDDLWRILGWSILGILVAVVIAGGIYVNQAVGQASIVDPEFLFEFLALVGAAFGIAFGVNRRARLKEGVEAVIETVDPADSEAVWFLLDRLDADDLTATRQRWTALARLVGTTTWEVPIDAFAVQLSNEVNSCFPDDETDVNTLLHEEHFPSLRENELIEINEEAQTVRYVGPERIAEYLSG